MHFLNSYPKNIITLKFEGNIVNVLVQILSTVDPSFLIFRHTFLTHFFFF